MKMASTTCYYCGVKFDRIIYLKKHLRECKSPKIPHGYKNTTRLRSKIAPVCSQQEIQIPADLGPEESHDMEISLPINESSYEPAACIEHNSHNGETALHCEKCAFLTRCDDDVAMHDKLHRKSRMFYCPHCEFSSRLSSEVDSHLKTHTNVKIPRCPLCHVEFEKIHPLLEHDCTNKKKPFRCDYCGRMFLKYGVLKIHRVVHNADTVFKCDQCDFTTLKIRNLRAHQQRTHVKAHECPLCSYKTGAQYRYDAHLLTHVSDKDLACSKCDFKTKWASVLQRHVEEQHSASGTYPCPKCDLEFPALSQLKVHAEKHDLRPPDFLKI